MAAVRRCKAWCFIHSRDHASAYLTRRRIGMRNDCDPLRLAAVKLPIRCQLASLSKKRGKSATGPSLRGCDCRPLTEKSFTRELYISLFTSSTSSTRPSCSQSSQSTHVLSVRWLITSIPKERHDRCMLRFVGRLPRALPLRRQDHQGHHATTTPQVALSYDRLGTWRCN
jgi:hypothetical protein